MLHVARRRRRHRRRRRRRGCARRSRRRQKTIHPRGSSLGRKRDKDDTRRGGHSRTSTHITSRKRRLSRPSSYQRGLVSWGERERERGLPRVHRYRYRPHDLITVTAAAVVVVGAAATAAAAARRNVRTCGATAEQTLINSLEPSLVLRALHAERNQDGVRRRCWDAPSHAVHSNYPNTNAAKRGIIGTVHATPFSFRHHGGRHGSRRAAARAETRRRTDVAPTTFFLARFKRARSRPITTFELVFTTVLFRALLNCALKIAN